MNVNSLNLNREILKSIYEGDLVTLKKHNDILLQVFTTLKTVEDKYLEEDERRPYFLEIALKNTKCPRVNYLGIIEILVKYGNVETPKNVLELIFSEDNPYRNGAYSILRRKIMSTTKSSSSFRFLASKMIQALETYKEAAFSTEISLFSCFLDLYGTNSTLTVDLRQDVENLAVRHGHFALYKALIEKT